MAFLLPSVQELLKNAPEEWAPAAEILVKFALNIIRDPSNEKFRKIRVGNAIVSTKLLPVCGAIECLFEMGFVEDGEFFTFPRSTSLVTLTLVKDQLASAMASKIAPVGQAIRTPAPTQAAAPNPPSQQATAQIFASEAKFYAKLTSSYNHVLIYEDSALQEKARSCIPYERLEKDATARHAECAANGPAPSIRDLFLLELIAWFKKDFFKWVDAPPCDSCSGKTQNVGMAEPTPAELLFGASRVENYLCSSCKSHTRFPRYNHPGKLLETRRGRCGEWANCFTLCCRATGFETRYVLDWTDHVWSEVYSEAQKRWLHSDPCENSCDKPLLYESGWGKKLTYVIAFAKDDIQDVTWRYSAKHAEVRARRTECRENWLVNVIVKMRKQRQDALGEGRKTVLGERQVREMAELMTIKEAGSGEDIGRQSGSSAWRMARGETGGGGSKAKAQVVITPSDTEKTQKLIHVQYNCAKDEYVRLSDGGKQIRGWQNFAYEAKSMQRKEEFDWGMVYLARQENTSTATITWKVDLEGSGLVVSSVDVTAESACYEDGVITWRLCSSDNCAIIPKGQSHLSTTDMDGSTTLTLVADLRKGQGDCAWQHTQLFRQKNDDTSVSFSLKITLRDN